MFSLNTFIKIINLYCNLFYSPIKNINSLLIAAILELVVQYDEIIYALTAKICCVLIFTFVVLYFFYFFFFFVKKI